MDNMTVSVLQWMDNARLVCNGWVAGRLAGLHRTVFILFGVMGERARPNITNSLYLNPTPPGISVGDI